MWILAEPHIVLDACAFRIVRLQTDLTPPYAWLQLICLSPALAAGFLLGPPPPWVTAVANRVPRPDLSATSELPDASLRLTPLGLISCLRTACASPVLLSQVTHCPKYPVHLHTVPCVNSRSGLVSPASE